MIATLAARFIVWPLIKKFIFGGLVMTVLTLSVTYIKHCKNGQTARRVNEKTELAVRQAIDSHNQKADSVRKLIIERYKELGERHADELLEIREQARQDAADSIDLVRPSGVTAFRAECEPIADDSEDDDWGIGTDLSTEEGRALCRDKCVVP